MNKKLKVIFIMIILILLSSNLVYAGNLSYADSNGDIRIHNESMPKEVITLSGRNIDVKSKFDSLLFVQGTEIILDGNFNGDVFVFGDKVTLKGNFNKNVYVAATEINYEAMTNGTMYSFSMFGNINSGSLQDTIAFSQSFNVNENVKINRDFISYAESLNLQGKFGRDLLITAEKVNFGGVADGKINAVTNIFNIEENAEIKSSIKNTSENSVIVDDGAVIEGNIENVIPLKNSGQQNLFLMLLTIITSIATFLIVFFTTKIVAPRMYLKANYYVSKKLFLIFAVGALTFLSLIFCTIPIIFFSPRLFFAIILFFVSFLLIAQVFAMVMLVPFIANVIGKNTISSKVGAVLIVMILYVGLKFSIPIVSPIFEMILGILGFGFVTYNIYISRKEYLFAIQNSKIISNNNNLQG